MASAVGRLTQRSEFLRVAAARRKWAAPGLVLQACERTDDAVAPGPPRVGFTATRKIGGAVVRNRARRRLRAAVAQVMPRSGLAGWDYVVIARDGTVERTFPDLVADLETALARVQRRRPAAGAEA
ncbi:ribonuclease P protein component [Stella sp.]|uniref:ribonuclease P protein component n=1 Tax=Stella sp. TaxID=2912054 RepID=UPI0035B37F83